MSNKKEQASETNMKLSIIVPVYNVEQYLPRCIESIVMQMHNDYELILIDDGSTDNSSSLCDNVAIEYPHLNITIQHQANKGLSAARNRGIEIAQGEYITFIDSDDYIDPQTLAPNMEILLAHPEIDMLEYPIEIHAGADKAHLLHFHHETISTEVFADWLQRRGYRHCYACNKIYKKQLWETTRFPIGIAFEDSAIMPEIIRLCRCIHYSAHGCYRYVAHDGTITTTYSYTKQRQLFANNHSLYIQIKDNPTLEREAMELWTCVLNLLIDMGRCTDIDHADYDKQVRETEWHRPPYRRLIRHAMRSPHRTKHIKLLPLPILGLTVYLRSYIALTPSL